MASYRLDIGLLSEVDGKTVMELMIPALICPIVAIHLTKEAVVAFRNAICAQNDVPGVHVTIMFDYFEYDEALKAVSCSPAVFFEPAGIEFGSLEAMSVLFYTNLQYTETLKSKISVIVEQERKTVQSNSIPLYNHPVDDGMSMAWTTYPCCFDMRRHDVLEVLELTYPSSHYGAESTITFIKVNLQKVKNLSLIAAVRVDCCYVANHIMTSLMRIFSFLKEKDE